MDIKTFVNDESEQDEDVEQLTDETEEVVEEQEVKPDGEATEKPVEEAGETKEKEPVSEEDQEPETEPRMVPLAALHEERDKRRALQEQLASQQQKQSEKPAESEPGQQQGLDPSDPDPSLAVDNDDYDLLLPSEQRDLSIKREAWKEREYTRQSQLIRQQQYNNMENEARQRMNAESMGQNLDYDSVIKTGNGWLTPEDKAAVTKSSDPAKQLYDLCLERCPYLSVVKADTSKNNSQEQSDEHKPEIPNPADAPKLSKIFAEDDKLGSMADSFIG